MLEYKRQLIDVNLLRESLTRSVSINLCKLLTIPTELSPIMSISWVKGKPECANFSKWLPEL